MRTRIAVTIGYSSRSRSIIREMALSGACIFRVNFSHGSPEEWVETARLVRSVEAELGKHFALLGDLRGPSVRLGDLKAPVEVKAGESVRIIQANESAGGSDKRIPLPSGEAFKAIRKDHVILMDDGRLVFKVESTSGSEISMRALTDATITSRKSIVIQGQDLDLPPITEEEIRAIRIAVENDFDYIGLSYVKCVEDIAALRGILISMGAREMGIIAKIETPVGVRKLDEIIDAADGILVARGDLGMHFPLEDVPSLQEKIVKKCVNKGKPVIVATQLLGSMIESPVPTRSEIVDVVSALSQGVDVLMLTGETAIGKYPVETVSWLARILERYESEIKPFRRTITGDNSISDRFAFGIVSLAESLGAMIGVFTKSGKTAERIASFKPDCRIVSASPNVKTLRKLMLLRSVETIEVSASEYEAGMNELEAKLSRMKNIQENTIAVLTYGFRDEPVHIVRIRQIRRASNELRV
ncbi:MAG: pyruvate kinase [Crenarchaeota archaeon]|nr:pyruvate kinase [Thermoproteota archaeon]MDW8034119.1 pyruvate kinase [Nitrososphaerota archaeon]